MSVLSHAQTAFGGRCAARIAALVALPILALLLPAMATAQAPPSPARRTETPRTLEEHATILLRGSWTMMSDGAEQGYNLVAPAVRGAGWYAARASSELLNVLGFNYLEPHIASGAGPTLPVRPAPADFAMPTLESFSPTGPDTAAQPARTAAIPTQPPSDRLAPGSGPAPRTAIQAVPTPPAPPAEAATNPPETLPTPRLGDGFVNDTPHRLPDGTLIIPKAAQRLYRIRTAQVATTETPVTVRLDGVVKHDPNRSGHVQASFIGRLELGEGSMPYLGMPVTRGQILAYLRSALTPAERAQLRTEIARTTGEILLSEKKIERYGKFFFVPFREGKIIQEKLRLESNLKQRTALLSALTDRDPIRASTNGVISAVNGAIGQIVEARQTLFEIVDPDSLWVEAVAYNTSFNTEITRASAITTDGIAMSLQYVGRGLELKQNAVPLHFRVEPRVANLTAGKPLSVTVQTGATTPGIVLSNESSVRTVNGTEIVWEKTGPEQFTARPVATRPLDATRFVILAGLEPGATIVTTSARLISQFR